MKKSALYYWVIVALLLSGMQLHAQDKNVNPEQADSVSAFHLNDLHEQPDSAPIADTTARVEEKAVDQVKYPMDTLLQSRLSPILPDSIHQIKKEKGYYYQSWLDSLLRAEDNKQLHAPRQEDFNWPNLDGFFNVLELILWLGAAGLLIFVVYKILGRSHFFSSNKKNVQASVELEDKNLDADRFETAIAAAESEGDYRLSTRFLFLQAMAALESRQLIKQSPGKTNVQYRQELKNAPVELRQLFDRLVRQYEYIWYGSYPLAGDDYQRLKKLFRDLIGYGL